jgi:hypothetical protein
MWDILVNGPRGGGDTEVTIGSGRFVIAWKKGNTCYVDGWDAEEVDYGDGTKDYFYFLYDEERVLDFTRWDQEAQRLYSFHIIDPLEYDKTGGNYIAVRRFTDTGEIYP